MKKTAILILIAIISGRSYCQSILDDIPDSLKENANEIVLNDETIYTISDVKNSSLTRRYKAVIVNENASDRNNIALFYDDFRKIEDAKVRVTDVNNVEIESYKMKDFDDFSTKSFSLASDNRAKYLDIKNRHYPYIIEVEYTIAYLGSMFYPQWMPQSDEKQSILNASLEIYSYQPVRFKVVNMPDMKNTFEANKYRYECTVDSLRSFVYEPYSYTLDEYAPIVYTAPNDFEMDNHGGSMATWEDFGRWILGLNENRNTLTNEDLSAVVAITKDLESTTEKVKAVYEYLQNNTRYVSIQLGIGGWQPLESKFVHEKKYGDCKALSFYTKSLLEGIGIPSYYTLINAGKNRDHIDPDFPSAHFNHAILTVPLEEDTVWLECTSQTNPFGYLGTFTSDRYALMITPEGGKLIRTKKYTADENIQRTSVHLKIQEDGSAKVQLERKYQGIEIENKHVDHYSLKPKTDQEKWFVDNSEWGSFKLLHLNLDLPSKEQVPTAGLSADLELHRSAVSSGKRLFYQPFIFTNLNSIKLSAQERNVPVEIKYAFTEVDSITVEFPQLYRPEKGLDDVVLDTKYGTYDRKVEAQEDGSYLFIRKFQFMKGTYAPEEYDAFRDFVRSVQKNDREKMVLVNKT